VVKLPILYALYERHDGHLDALDEPRGLADENRVGGSGVLHLLEGIEPTLADLATAMITISDNAATNELIDYLGTGAINDAAATLGMERTHLGRKMMTTLGDDGDAAATTTADGAADAGTDAEPTNTTSPLDCARFYAALIHGSDLSERARDAMLDILANQKYGSKFPRYLDYDIELAHKTGTLPTAALDAGVVRPHGERPLYFGVFVDRVSNAGDGADVIAEIGDAAFRWLDEQAVEM
jgi:beta-lactamase class A